MECRDKKDWGLLKINTRHNLCNVPWQTTEILIGIVGGSSIKYTSLFSMADCNGRISMNGEINNYCFGSC